MAKQKPPSAIPKSDIPTPSKAHDTSDSDVFAVDTVKDGTVAPKQTKPEVSAPQAVEERPRRESATKCIYFKDSEQLSELEGLSKLYPNSSVSSIIQQLVANLLEANARQTAENRCLEFSCKIYL
jgi:hypothetical protein